MKKLCILVACVNCGLCFAGEIKFDTHNFGDGGIVSIPSPFGVFDFSKNGRYVWLTETNCFDLTGRRIEFGALDKLSFPLSRMKWKNLLLGDGGRYSLSKIRTNIHNAAVRSVGMECPSSKDGDGDWICKSSLTSYAESGPLITVVVRSSLRNNYYMIAARVGSGGEIGCGTAKLMTPLITRDSACGIELSADMKHMAKIGFEKDFNIKITLSDIKCDYSSVSENAGGVVVTSSGLHGSLDDENFRIDDFGVHGFIDDNYYVFTGRSGGRFSFTARDYLFVYGFREKRIVKVFKSKLRVLSEGCRIFDDDVALSADEKYLAIRYDGILTVYPFVVPESISISSDP